MLDTNNINECIDTTIGGNSREYKTYKELVYDLTNSKEVIGFGIFQNKLQTKYTESQFFKASQLLNDFVKFRHIYIDSVPNVYDFELIRSLKVMSLPIVILIRPKYLWNRFETRFVVYSFGEITEFIKFNYLKLSSHNH